MAVTERRGPIRRWAGPGLLAVLTIGSPVVLGWVHGWYKDNETAIGALQHVVTQNKQHIEDLQNQVNRECKP